jgi:hypothetical protein
MFVRSSRLPFDIGDIFKKEGGQLLPFRNDQFLQARSTSQQRLHEGQTSVPPCLNQQSIAPLRTRGSALQIYRQSHPKKSRSSQPACRLRVDIKVVALA